MLGAVQSAILCALVCASSARAACPAPCECSEAAQTVKCVSKDLREIPAGIPGYTRNLFILGNQITRIGPESFKGLENVTNLSLSNNRIAQLESGAFGGLHSLRSLDLSGNELRELQPGALTVPAPLRDLNLSHALHSRSALPALAWALRGGVFGGLAQLDLSANGLVLLPSAMFLPLGALRRLLLANNSLVALQNGSLLGLERLAWLDLSLNGFRTFRKEALGELDRLGGARLLLGGNPLACVCGAEDFADWLNGSYARVADGDRLVCASPPEMHNTTLRTLGGRDLGCHGDGAGEGAELALQTSYAFLGVVLGLVGVVFLCVLYLNRTGIKKWVTDLREACRDVLEGYHYRYEIDSDPRLGPPPSSAHL
ncbi:trophoblast glycoprotein-like [Conger conger]|uniref:trophoblast glycoprotein-like n=1 Tax=Conger conger TaxID=82655 RepID=UPI002A59939C|nr:trophoblast glycoprotein-like [Conger conger]